MLNVVLYQPEIPPNTGNIIRLCANAQALLHLIHPMGFDLSEKQVRRAGLDYRHLAIVREYAHYEDFMSRAKPHTLWACTTKGTVAYANVHYTDNDFLLFGPETRGLPAEQLNAVSQDHRIRIPMQLGSRSLNLSNACAIILYEAWRQLGFSGSCTVG